MVDDVEGDVTDAEDAGAVDADAEDVSAGGAGAEDVDVDDVDRKCRSGWCRCRRCRCRNADVESVVGGEADGLGLGLNSCGKEEHQASVTESYLRRGLVEQRE